jgi:hypothetical protein
VANKKVRANTVKVEPKTKAPAQPKKSRKRTRKEAGLEEGKEDGPKRKQRKVQTKVISLPKIKAF